MYYSCAKTAVLRQNCGARTNSIWGMLAQRFLFTENLLYEYLERASQLEYRRTVGQSMPMQSNNFDIFELVLDSSSNNYEWVWDVLLIMNNIRKIHLMKNFSNNVETGSWSRPLL